MDQRGSQITLTDNERDRIGEKIWHDFIGARSNHDNRIERFRRYMRLWRGLEMGQGNPDDGASFEVPLVKWTVFAHWARIMQGLLGDDAEIVATAQGPNASKTAKKVGHYMTWRFFEYMKAQPQLSAWVFRGVLNGRAHAFCPYDQDFFIQVDPKTRKETEVCWYDGPRLTSLYPSEFILPAQDGVNCSDDHSFNIRRTRVTPQQLLDGESAGIYDGVTENWGEIYAMSQQRQERNYWYDDEKIDIDEAEGINHATMLGNRDTLELWSWYSTWRLPNSKRDARPENLKFRQTKESELVVSYLPAMRKVIGVQDLRQIYPRMRKRRPFLDLGLVKDGSYWCPGLGEMLEWLQSKETANYALFEKAGKLSVGPLIFYKPGSGFDPDKFEYEPNKAVPSADPASVNVVRMQANLDFSATNGQVLDSYAERVVGVSDQTLGRSIDRPNAPQTATGQVALLEQGNVRAALDMYMLREDLGDAMEFIWLLDREFSDEEVFFRATEEDADGQYDVSDGFGRMTVQEREHGFDFALKFATSVWSREADKDRLMQVYGALMQNPLVMQNPRALWVLMSKLWDAFGYGDFGEVIPKPADLDEPKDPKEEWAMALQGEEIDVNPADDDKAHILRHTRDLEREQIAKPEDRDPRAVAEMSQHIVEHQKQIRQKMLLQAVVQRAQAEAAQQGQSAPGMPPQGPPQAGPPPGAASPGPPAPAPPGVQSPQAPPGPPAPPAINTVKNAVAQAAPTALGGPPTQ